MTGFRAWAVSVFGPRDGGQLADEFTTALAEELDVAILTGQKQSEPPNPFRRTP